MRAYINSTSDSSKRFFISCVTERGRSLWFRTADFVDKSTTLERNCERRGSILFTIVYKPCQILKKEPICVKVIGLLWMREVDFVYACLQNALFEKIDAMLTGQMKKNTQPSSDRKDLLRFTNSRKKDTVSSKIKDLHFSNCERRGSILFTAVYKRAFSSVRFFSGLSKRSGREPLFTAKL